MSTKNSVDDSEFKSDGPLRRAKLFRNGRSQAVRLPLEFRFKGKEVLIHREGRRVVLEPVQAETDEYGWPVGHWDALDRLGRSQIERPPQPPVPEPKSW